MSNSNDNQNQPLFFKGMSFGFYARNGYFASQKAREQIDKMAALGIDWICLISTVLQETMTSTRQFRDFQVTPADDELRDITAYCHKKGLKVMLRPMIECWDGTQRCHINFPNDGEIIPGKPIRYWTKWFESYADLTRHYCRLATRAGCEAYSLDSELNQTVRQNEHWLKVIDVARKEFGGHLTTSMISTQQFIDQLENPDHWFFALDSLGSSMYSPAADKAGASVDEMAAFLQQTCLPDYRKFAEVYGKPFYFGETGCCATAGAAKLPYFWNNGGGYDGQEQANYMEATIKAFGAEPWWRGLFWWKWDEQNERPQFHDDPAGDKGFTIDGKPAAKVMQNWEKQS
jgi:hypothetical protein